MQCYEWAHLRSNTLHEHCHTCRSTFNWIQCKSLPWFSQRKCQDKPINFRRKISNDLWNCWELKNSLCAYAWACKQLLFNAAQLIWIEYNKQTSLNESVGCTNSTNTKIRWSWASDMQMIQRHWFSALRASQAQIIAHWKIGRNSFDRSEQFEQPIVQWMYVRCSRDF